MMIASVKKLSDADRIDYHIGNENIHFQSPTFAGLESVRIILKAS
jgi:hypothetical protein